MEGQAAGKAGQGENEIGDDRYGPSRWDRSERQRHQVRRLCPLVSEGVTVGVPIRWMVQRPQHHLSVWLAFRDEAYEAPK